MLLLVALTMITVGFAASITSRDASPSGLSLKDPAKLALQIDAMLDKAGPGRINPSSLSAWNAEIPVWYAETGIIDVPEQANAHFSWLNPDEANHVLGYTYCVDGDITINARYANPVSPWYGDPGMVFTLAHELAHIQQGMGCALYSSARVETGAQLAAFEVMAAMANSGSKVALVAMLAELRDLALGTLRYDALLHPDKRAALASLYQRIMSPVELAERTQRDRYWSQHKAEQRDMLKKYVVAPYRLLAEGLKTGSIPNVVAGGTVETLSLADLLYTLAHADDLLG